MDLGRLWGTRSLRWVLVRVKHLPPESAAWTLYRDEQESASNRMSVREFLGKNKQRILGGR